MIAATLSASVCICLQPDGSACQGHTAAPGDKKQGHAPVVILNMHIIKIFLRVSMVPAILKDITAIMKYVTATLYMEFQVAGDSLQLTDRAQKHTLT